MLPRDILIAILVSVVWGFSFAAIKFGISEVPPLFLAVLRFVAVAFPADRRQLPLWRRW